MAPRVPCSLERPVLTVIVEHPLVLTSPSFHGEWTPSPAWSCEPLPPPAGQHPTHLFCGQAWGTRHCRPAVAKRDGCRLRDAVVASTVELAVLDRVRRIPVELNHCVVPDVADVPVPVRPPGPFHVVALTGRQAVPARRRGAIGVRAETGRRL